MRGRSPGQLQRPTGVAVHPNGEIMIADYDNKWVSIFSSDGKYKVRTTKCVPDINYIKFEQPKPVHCPVVTVCFITFTR